MGLTTAPVAATVGVRWGKEWGQALQVKMYFQATSYKLHTPRTTTTH